MTTHVAIYARHSSDKQTTSTEDQIARCRDFCEKAGYTVEMIFHDEALSGEFVINRPGISDLIDAAVGGYFDRVISEDLSRISRGQGDIAHLYQRLCFLDIALETVAEGEINELHIGLKGTMNALYLKDLGDKTRRGMIASVLKGAVPGGRAYGYDTVRKLNDKGEFVRGLRKINAQETEIVRFIFERYAHGSTLAEICSALNRQRIPSPKGGKWVSSTLVGQETRKTGLLRQTLYRGLVTFNRMEFRKNPETGKRLSFVRPESEWIRVPVPELTILDVALFDRVQKLVLERSSKRREKRLLNQVLDQAEKPKIVEKRERQKKARANKPKTRQVNLYVFSGKLWCAEHDTAISVVRKRIYHCPVKTCRHRYLKHEALMNAALDAMGQLHVDQIKTANKEQRRLREKLEAEIADKETGLSSARQQIRNVLDALAHRKITPETTEYLDRCEAKVLKFKHELDKLNKKIAPITHIPDAEAEDVLCAFLSVVASLRQDPDNQILIGRAFPWFTRFTVSPDLAVTIQYNWQNLFATLRG